MSSFIKSPNVPSPRTGCAEPCWRTPGWCTCEEKSLVQRYNWKSLLHGKLLVAAVEAKFMMD